MRINDPTVCTWGHCALCGLTYPDTELVIMFVIDPPGRAGGFSPYLERKRPDHAQCLECHSKVVQHDGPESCSTLRDLRDGLIGLEGWETRPWHDHYYIEVEDGDVWLEVYEWDNPEGNDG